MVDFPSLMFAEHNLNDKLKISKALRLNSLISRKNPDGTPIS